VTTPPEGRYRTDANYYRLAYQLAAQQLNRAVGIRERTIKERGAIPRLHRLVGDDGISAGNEVAKNARLVLDWYDSREKEARKWWPDQRKLKPPERRLQHFLSGTVEPCAILVVAGALVNHGKHDEAAAYLANFDDRRSRDDWSYRAYYNLACYEAARGHSVTPQRGLQAEAIEDDPFELALAAFRAAMRKVHGRSRRELVRWAQKDPSLRPLRNDKRFGPSFLALLKRYEVPESEHALANG
jgi:hypothetical protein